MKYAAGISDRVVDPDELHADRTQLEDIACTDDVELGLCRQTVLGQLVADDADGQLGAVDGGIDGAQDIGDRADVVLMPVREQDAADAILVLFQVGDIGNDEVDAQHFLVGKAETAVNDDDVVLIFDDGQIFADLVQSAKRNDAYFT